MLDDGDLSTRGAGLYLNQCSTCHGRDGRGHGDLLPPIAGNASVLQHDPSSVLNIILNGGGRIVVNGVPDSYRMTPFRVLLSDEQIADVASFIRHDDVLRPGGDGPGFQPGGLPRARPAASGDPGVSAAAT